MPAAAPVSQEILKPLLEIEGGHRLSGELRVSGAKNSALVLMTAALLSSEPLRLSNVPELTDIDGMSEILRVLGVHVQRDGSTVEIHAGQLQHGEPPYELVNGLRASFFAIGPLLGRLGRAKVPLPGGCRIGARPVVEHIRGLKALGAVVNVEHGVVSAAVLDRAGLPERGRDGNHPDGGRSRRWHQRDRKCSAGA
jgi:UDP-N-acetylglucosamine 1-carboxyvinyltransferase